MSNAVNARILYWGVQGAGKRTNLRQIHAKLRPDHRGDLVATPTRIDPSVSYAELPIELGDLGGMPTRIQLVAAPSGTEQAPTRQQLLDQIDGIVFVVDTRREELTANLASLTELRELLATYGRRLEDLPMVFQYNKRDLSDEHALEELHRKLDLPRLAAFEAVACDGTGVLQTLTTISKGVVRVLRERAPAAEAAAPEAAPLLLDGDLLETETSQTDPVPTEGLAPDLLVPEGAQDASVIEETSALAEAAFEDSFREMTEAPALLEEDDTHDAALALEQLAPVEAERHLEIAQVGTARAVGARSVAVPLVLRDETGTQRSVTLTVSLDALADDGD